MNEKRGMKPGEDGGIDPLTLLRWRRRHRRRIAKAMAAAPRKPRGIPTPRPIFCLFVNPSPEAPGSVVDVVDDVGFAEGSLDGDAGPVVVGFVEEATVLESDEVSVVMLVENPELDCDGSVDCDTPEDCDAPVDSGAPDVCELSGPLEICEAEG
jgi:hypothetical protein